MKRDRSNAVNAVVWTAYGATMLTLVTVATGLTPGAALALTVIVLVAVLGAIEWFASS